MIEGKEHVLNEKLKVLALKTCNNLGLTQGEKTDRFSTGEIFHSNTETRTYMHGTIIISPLLVKHENTNMHLEYLNKKFQKPYEKELY